MELGPSLVAITGGIATELFFRVVKYRDALNQVGPQPVFSGYIPLYQPIGYMSVAEFLSGGNRRWAAYFAFRVIPPTISLLLIAAILQRYYPHVTVAGYILLTTTLTILTHDIWPALRAKYISERLVHGMNILSVYAVTILLGYAVQWCDIGFMAPSIAGLFDNLWSTALVAGVVVLYAEITNPRTRWRDQEADRRALENYVVRSYSKIKVQFQTTIDDASARYNCSRPILYAVIIYEDLNRPVWLRRIENLVVGVIRRELTVGIAQVKSDRPLTDEESIEKAARILSGSASADRGYGTGFVNLQQLETILEQYNSSGLYAESVAQIMSVLRQYTQGVFPSSWGRPGGSA